jgi:hypothetical protein
MRLLHTQKGCRCDTMRVKSFTQMKGLDVLGVVCDSSHRRSQLQLALHATHRDTQ